MAGKQGQVSTCVNHGLTKRLVAYAKDTKAALVLEEFTHIRDRMTVRKTQRNKQHNWSFRQLREFVVYKAQRAGVPLLFVDPRNTSRTCTAVPMSRRTARVKPISPVCAVAIKPTQT